MAARLDSALYADTSEYYQWEWQESEYIWRRYPCTINHKLNSIMDGQTIYAEIYSWIYIITKQNKLCGQQINLFTQNKRKIRLITHSHSHSQTQRIDDEKKDIDDDEPESISLFYNYSFANIVLLSNLEHNKTKVKNLFSKSMPSTEYELLSISHVQLSQNNKQYENYKKLLKQNCLKYNKRKDEIEILLWSNCNSNGKNKIYAHCNHVIDIVQNDNNNHKKKSFVYFCRAIFIKNNDNNNDENTEEIKSENELLGDTIDPEEVIDIIPLYYVSFKPLLTKSLYVINGHSDENSKLLRKNSFRSYSQPLLTLKSKLSSPNVNKSSPNVNNIHNKSSSNYGSIANKKKKEDYTKSWHELIKSEDEEYYSSTFDINIIIDKLLSARELKPGTFVDIARVDIENICTYSKAVLMQQPVFLELESPINIVGDIHGQFYDLLRLFEYGLYPPQSNYLFLGDYVDRGGQSLECIILLLCYKIKYEENFFLLRGNHESENINRIYGFYDECKRRYSVRLWRKFVDVFNHLPIAATICNKIFCVHGGLSPQLFLTGDNNHNIPMTNGSKLEENYGNDKLLSFDNNVKRIQRPTDIGDYGLVCDLLWSDPSFEIDGFYENGDRGVSYYFGKDIVDCFNKNFEIDLICRAHQVVEDGYEFFNKRSLVTIFSAPNYCGEFDNCAAYMVVDDNLKCSFTSLDPQRRYKHQIVQRKR